MSLAIVFLAFFGLTLLTLWRRGAGFLRTRSTGEWLLDGTGLLVQGLGVPLAQLGVTFLLIESLAPGLAGALRVTPVLAFLVGFVGIDWLYYWNHRLLHGSRLWPLHAVHHSAERLDVLMTGRNTLWTPLGIVYLWLNALGVYLLAEPAPFLLAAALTASLDLWRHSDLGPRPDGALHRWLSLLLVTPHLHGWHHSREEVRANFGANLTLWDRLHGTFHGPVAPPSAYGVLLEGGARRRLLIPFGRGTP